MTDIKLKDMTYGEFQEKLVKHVLNKIDKDTSTSALVYFPVVHERVEAYLLAHWQEAWVNCSDLTWHEWLTSSCNETFEADVVEDLLTANPHLEAGIAAEESPQLETN